MTFDDLKRVSKEEILARLGLVPEPGVFDYLLPALGLFSAGLLLGTGLGLMLAPKPGTELREELAERYAHALRSMRGEQTTTAVPTPTRA